MHRLGRNKITVEGIVEAPRDADGNLIRVSIHTDGGNVFPVALDRRGRRLAETAPGQRVRLRGVVSDPDDDFSLAVRRYTVLGGESEEPPWYRRWAM